MEKVGGRSFPALIDTGYLRVQMKIPFMYKEYHQKCISKESNIFCYEEYFCDPQTDEENRDAIDVYRILLLY